MKMYIFIYAGDEIEAGHAGNLTGRSLNILYIFDSYIDVIFFCQ